MCECLCIYLTGRNGPQGAAHQSAVTQSRDAEELGWRSRTALLSGPAAPPGFLRASLHLTVYLMVCKTTLTEI